MENIEERIENIKNIIRKCRDRDLENIIIKEGNIKVISMKNEGKIVINVPREYLHDIQLTLNEEKNLRSVKRTNEYVDNIRMVNGVTEEELSIFRETNKRRRAERTGNRKINIKNNPKKNNKKNKYKQQKGNKLRNIIIGVGIGAIAIGGAANIISNIANEEREYNEVAATVQTLNEKQIVKEAEEELKKEIGEATGENKEDIIISDKWIDSSTHVTTVTAGENEYKYINDSKGFNEENKISNLISEIKNTGGDRRKAITSLKNVRKFSKNNKIVIKDDKLVEEEKSKEER